MTYGSVVSNEEASPQYRVVGRVETANGSAVFQMSLDVEGSDPLFTPDADDAFQDLLDRIAGSEYLTSIQEARKTWGSHRVATPTE